MLQSGMLNLSTYFLILLLKNVIVANPHSNKAHLLLQMCKITKFTWSSWLTFFLYWYLRRQKVLIHGSFWFYGQRPVIAKTSPTPDYDSRRYRKALFHALSARLYLRHSWSRFSSSPLFELSAVLLVQPQPHWITMHLIFRSEKDQCWLIEFR